MSSEAPQQWTSTECVFCGHAYEEHLEPNADTPYCMTCDDPENPTQHNFAAHYMGWPTEHVNALQQTNTALVAALREIVVDGELHSRPGECCCLVPEWMWEKANNALLGEQPR